MPDDAERLRKHQEVADALHQTLDRFFAYTRGEVVCGICRALVQYCESREIPIHKALWVVLEVHENDQDPRI